MTETHQVANRLSRHCCFPKNPGDLLKLLRDDDKLSHSQGQMANCSPDDIETSGICDDKKERTVSNKVAEQSTHQALLICQLYRLRHVTKDMMDVISKSVFFIKDSVTKSTGKVRFSFVFAHQVTLQVISDEQDPICHTFQLLLVKCLILHE